MLSIGASSVTNEMEAMQATTFTVNTFLDTVDANPGDGYARDASGKTSLRAAVMEANSLSGAQTINLPAGTYRLTLGGMNEDVAATGDLDIKGELSIAGDGASQTIIDATGLNDRVFDMKSGWTTQLQDLTIKGGRISDNSAPGDCGGGIRVESSANVTLSDCILKENSAPRKSEPNSLLGSGGAIYSSGMLTILDSRFEGNSASNLGGALCVDGIGTTAVIRNTSFSGNRSFYGGAIDNHGTVSIESSTFSDNTTGALGNGSGGALRNLASLTLTNCTISHNGSGNGGGIFNSGTLTILNNTITGNLAGGGSGLRNTGTASLENTIIAGNFEGWGDGTDDVWGTITSLGHNLIGNTAGSTGFSATGDLLNVDAKLGPLADNGGPTKTHALLPGSPAIDAANPATSPATDQRGVIRPQGASADIGAFEHVGSGEIRGSKWNDADRDGLRDPAEPAMAGWTVFLDSDSDGQLDDSETSTTTDANGDYAFTHLAPGTYTVAEVNQSGWLQTYPTTTSGGTGKLTFLQAFHFDKAGIEGIAGVNAAGVISPDGNHVYSPSYNNDSLAVFSRNAQTGELAFIQVVLDGQADVDGLAGAGTAILDPEGRHLYVVGVDDDAIDVFDRDVVTGRLTFRQSLKDGQDGVDGLNGAIGIAISPDGQHVYVSAYDDNSVALFQRDASTGQLIFVEMIKNGKGGVTGMTGPYWMELSPDGRHAYVSVGYKEVLRFDRDTTTGRLTFVESMGRIGQFSGNSFSADGTYAYVASYSDDELIVYRRDAVSGVLTNVQAIRADALGVYGMGWVNQASIGPDGRYVLMSAGSVMVIFERDSTTGRLSFVHAVEASGAPLFSPDARHVYMADDGGSVFSCDLGAIQPVSHSVTLGLAQSMADVDFGGWSGVSVTESNAHTDVVEGSTQDTYELSLLRCPDAAVEITVTADSKTEVSLDGASFHRSVTFTRTDMAPQTIAVRAIDDAMAENDYTGTIRHAITGVVADPNYPVTLSIDNVTVHVTDNDVPAVALSIAAASISERNSPGVTTATVTRNTDPTDPLVVLLSTNEPSQAAVPPSVTIPAGQMSATFNITAVNDAIVDGSRTVMVTARAAMWPEETVDSMGAVGPWASLALDGANQPRIAYASFSNGDLKYASYDDGRWNVETVDRSYYSGDGSVSLALDTQGHPHIAYQDHNDPIRYVYRNGTSWQFENVSYSSYSYLSLAVNSQDRPLISFLNGYTNGLSLAERGDVSWNVTGLSDSNMTGGYCTSLVLDAANNPWISFANATWSELQLAHRVAGVWQFETVDFGSSFGDTSLVLDTFGRPHISYYDGTLKDLKYVYFDGTTWHRTSVDTEGSVGGYNSLALDSANRPCISYTSPDGVKFAHFDGVQWTLEVIAANASCPSLAITRDDRAIVAYYDTVTGDLLVARPVALEAATDTVEVTDDDVLTLTLSIAASSIHEAAGTGANTGTVTRNDGDLSSPLTVNLSSDDTSEVAVPATVVIPAGQASATFAIDAVDDRIIDGTQTATITAAAVGYVSDMATLEVTNDDGPRLVLTIAEASMSEAAGAEAATATVTRNADTTAPLVVALSSGDASEASVPRFVTIPAGQASVQFAIDAIDDSLVDRTQTVTISAEAPDQLVLDRGFGSAGSIVVPGTSVYATARQADGKIVAVGSQGTLFWAARYHSDGTLDASFAEDGVFTSSLGVMSAKGCSVGIQADGKIVVGGDAYDPHYNYDFLLVRLNSNGTLDASFGGDGVVTTNVGGQAFGDSIREIAVLPDGKILAAGNSINFVLARYNADGSLDASFGTNGVVYKRLTDYHDHPYAMLVQGDGSIILGGMAGLSSAQSPGIALVKYKSTGAIDTTFGTDGTVRTGLADGYTYGGDLALQADNKIVLAGKTATPNIVSREYDFVVLRYNTNGTLDNTFGTNGVARTDVHSHSDDMAVAVAIQADGKIVAAGVSDGRVGYIRYNTDGTVDVADFGSSTGTSAKHVEIHPDGDVIIAGSKGTTDGLIERYQPASFSFPAAVDTVEVTDDDVLTLTLTIDVASISENGGRATATVTRNDADLSIPLTVLLTSSDTNEAAVPASVTIPSGSASATFPVTAVDDVHPEPTHTVTITASSTDYVQDSVSLKVIDDEGLMLTVSIDTASISEKGGLTTATVTRNDYDLANPLVVSLTSSDTTEATLPPSVTIPAGSASATFMIVAADDLVVDSTQAVTITAKAAGHASGMKTLDVLDDETPRLVLTIVAAFVSEGAGAGATTATLTRNTDLANDLVVSLTSDDATEAMVPASVTIPAGKTTVSFLIDAVDDAIVDGTQTVTITASAVGFARGSDAVGVLDNDVSLPDINIKGNGRAIVDGDRFPSPNDHTHFGKVDLAGAPATRTFTIENLGDGNLDLSGASLVQIIGPAAGDFTATSTPSTSVASQSSATFDIQFKPSSPGLRSATVVIVSNDPDESPYEFAIQGIGEADLGDAGQRAFEFVSVLDTTALPGVAFPSWPDVNNAGEIAVPVSAGFTKTLYAVGADGIRPLLQDTIGLECILGGFNDAGQAVLRITGGGADDDLVRVLLTDGVVVTTIQQGDISYDRWRELSLNDLGEVAYLAGNIRSNIALVKYYTDGSLETAVDYRGLITSLHYEQNVSLNNNGQLVFTGWGKSSPTATATPGGFVYDSATGAITRFADCYSEYDWETCLAPTINDSGEIAYIDRYGSTEARLWKKDGDELTLIAQAGGGFLFVSNPVINNNGDVVFSGTLPTRERGLFIGPDPVADRIIAEGDSLFGSTVLSIKFHRGFNDQGQIAFTYSLANGVSGVALATPTYSYSTCLSDNGAWHIATGPTLGVSRDIESDGQPSSLAVGDDDDGVTFTSPLTPGQNATFTVTASGAGFLNAWVDFNDDGDWDDSGEQVFADRSLAPGANNLSFAVPANATVTDRTFARFRFNSTGGLSSFGSAADGEVEDYGLQITAPSELRGMVWNDLDGDGERDTEEPGLANSQIYLDTNGNGQWDATEAMQTTDANGNFSFPMLAAGTYTIREVVPNGWLQTAPVSGNYSVTLAAGDIKTGFDFGNHAQTAPVAVGDSYQVDEDTLLTRSAPGVLANDTDVNGDLLSAILVTGPNHGSLTLNANGSFTYQPAANYHGPDSFTYKVNDGHVDSSVATVSITVNPINDPPTLTLSNTATTLAENTSTASRVKMADITVSDDGQGSNILSLAGADAALFEIVGNVLYLKAGTALDYEAQRQLTVIVQVDDSSVGTTPDSAASLSIAINDVNLAPTDLTLSATSLAEDQPAGTVVGTFSTTAPEAPAGPFTYTLVSGPGSTDNGSFAISGPQLKTAATLNYEEKTSYSIRVRTTDPGGLWYEEAITIAVTDVTALGDLLYTLDDPGSTPQASHFGDAVAADGELMVVGSPYAELQLRGIVGVAYVFNRTTGAMVATLRNPTPSFQDYFGSSVAISGNTVVVGAYGDDTGATDAGAAYVFDATTGDFLHTLANPTPGAGDHFGSSVAVSGNAVVVGAYGDDTGATDAGAAYVFDAATGDFLRTLANPMPAAGDSFGSSVAVSGNAVVVGAYGDDTGATDAGAAYVFDATTGVLLRTLANPTPGAGDEFGSSVAVSGSTVVVGALSDDTGAQDAGAAYVFDATTGVLLRTLANPMPAAGDSFGSSVAVSGSMVVVGTPGDDTGAADAGAAYVFDATTGVLLHTLANPAPVIGDSFSSSVAVAGGTVIVGTPDDDTGATNAGVAYVIDATTGVLLHTLANPTPAVMDHFGWSVAVSGSTMVVGAYGDDTGATDAGAAYVFDAATGILLHALANPTPAASDSFGYRVAVSGSTVVVGAFEDDAGATDAGAAYVFDAMTGDLLHTLANPAPAFADEFGFSVAVSGNTVVVGAPGDSTGATDAGAAYVFDATTGVLLRTLANPTPAVRDQFGLSVAVSGSTVVVGAYGDDTGTTDAGAAYVFDATTGVLLHTLANPTPAAGDYFASSVAISGTTVVVGAYYDATGATNAGAAYVFDATSGVLLRTLANPAPAASDYFGYSVAVSGSTVVVGAHQDDTGATNAGAAYVFDATSGVLLRTLANPAPTAYDDFGSSVAVSGSAIVVGAHGEDVPFWDRGAAYVFDATRAPTDIRLSSASIPENQLAGTLIGAFTTTDPNLPDDSHTYTLVAGNGDADNASFTIDGNELRTKASFNYEAKASYSIRVRTTDSGGKSCEKALTITVTNVNEAPTGITLSATSLAENLPAGTAIGTFATTDPDGAGTFVYTLVAGEGSTDNAKFRIVGNELRTAASLDYEAQASYVIRVESRDAGGLSVVKNFTINLIDVNLAPTDLSLSATSLAEDQPAGTVVGTFSTTDPEAPAGPFTYTLVPGPGSTDNNCFAISGDQLKTAVTLNYEEKTSYSIRVRTTDQNGLWCEKVFTIAVTDVNESPTVALTNTVTSFAENTDTTIRIKVADIGVTDDALGTNTLSLAGADAALFEIAGNILYLKAGTKLDYETKPQLVVTVQVDDTSVGTTPDGSASLTITVTDVNEPPTMALTNTTTTLPENVNTNGRVKVADIVVTDDALGANIPSLAGADAALFEIEGSGLYLKAGTKLDYETKPQLAVTVQVDDNSVGTTPDGSASLTITVTDVNEPPKVALANQTPYLSENTDTTNRIRIADIVVTDDALGTNNLILAGTDAALFEIRESVLYLKAGTKLDYETNPQLGVIVYVDDPSIGTTSEWFVSTAFPISDDNDPPTVSLDNTTTTLPENANANNRIKVADIVVTDDGFGANLLSLAGEDAAAFEIIGRELYVRMATPLDYETKRQLAVTVQVNDNAVGTTPDSSASLTITIADVNEAPSVSLVNPITVLPENVNATNRVKVADIVVTDDALGTNVLSLVGADVALFELIGNELYLRAGTVLDYETKPQLSVTVDVDDNAVGTMPDGTATLPITVTDVNEAPTEITLSAASLAENLPAGTAIGTFATTDPDGNGTFVYTLVDNGWSDDNAKFTIVGNELRTVAALNYESQASYAIRVASTDAGGLSMEKSFTIQVTNVNEPPTVTLVNMVTRLPENTDTTNRVKVADIVVTDDALGSKLLSLTGPNVGLFESAGGVLYLRAGTVLDYEVLSQLNVIVTVDDSSVGTTPDSTASLSITITDVSPTAEAGGAYTVSEGGTVVLGGSGQVYGGGSEGLGYAWDFDGDGVFDDATGPTPSFPAALLDGPGTVTIALQVTEQGETSVDMATVTIANVAPGITELTAPEMIGEGLTVTLSGRFLDGLAQDGHTATIDWGDGTSSPAVVDAVLGSFAASHAYGNAGQYTVTATVQDDDGGVDQESLTVEVVPHLGAVGFARTSIADLTGGDRWFCLETARAGYLTVEGLATGGGTLQLELYDVSSPWLSAATILGNGKKRLDVEAPANECYYLRVQGTGTGVELSVANLVHREGQAIDVFGTAEEDEFAFDAASGSITVNGLVYQFAGDVSVRFDGDAGKDQAVLLGSTGDDSVVLTASGGRLTGSGYRVTLTNVAQTTVDGSGGADVVYLYGTENEDTFTAEPGQATLAGTGYSLKVVDFEAIHAIGADGDDTAVLRDSAGAEPPGGQARGYPALWAGLLSPGQGVFDGDGLRHGRLGRSGRVLRLPGRRHAERLASSGDPDGNRIHPDDLRLRHAPGQRLRRPRPGPLGGQHQTRRVLGLSPVQPPARRGLHAPGEPF